MEKECKDFWVCKIISNGQIWILEFPKEKRSDNFAEDLFKYVVAKHFKILLKCQFLLNQSTNLLQSNAISVEFVYRFYKMNYKCILKWFIIAKKIFKMEEWYYLILRLIIKLPGPRQMNSLEIDLDI